MFLFPPTIHKRSENINAVAETQSELSLLRPEASTYQLKLFAFLLSSTEKSEAYPLLPGKLRAALEIRILNNSFVACSQIRLHEQMVSLVD